MAVNVNNAQDNRGQRPAPRQTSDRPPFFQRVKKTIREVVSELKKVEWPPFKSTPKTSGVWAQTGVVLIVVAFFLIVMVAFDSGLLALLRLLTTDPKTAK